MNSILPTHGSEDLAAHDLPKGCLKADPCSKGRPFSYGHSWMTGALTSIVRGLPVSPAPPHFLLSFPITSYFFAIISNLPRCLSTLRDLSQAIATIADHRRRPHSLARHRPALSQRPSKYGRLGTIHGHLYIHIPH